MQKEMGSDDLAMAGCVWCGFERLRANFTCNGAAGDRRDSNSLSNFYFHFDTDDFSARKNIDTKSNADLHAVPYRGYGDISSCFRSGELNRRL